MLTLLYISLIINIISIVISFFMLLSTSFVYALIIAAAGILSLVPIFVLINHIEDIENLKTDVSRLQSRVKRLSDLLNEELSENEITPISGTSVPSALISGNGTPAAAVWECVKCGTVNKAGTSKCVGCNADYSPLINPTDTQKRKKKKISRWIK